MSFSAETIFEPPNKLPRLSISIGGGGGHRHPYPHYHHIALSCIHHRDVSVALLTNDAGDCCDDGHFQYPSSLLVVESEKGICIKSNVSAEINSIRRKSSSNGSVPNIIVKDDAFSSSSSSSSSKSSSYSSSSSILCQTLNPPALPPPQPPPLHLATLQPHLWPQLPQEIVEHILAFLPIHALFRFSTVCTSWRALVLSRAFMQTRILLQASSSLSSSALRHHHHHHHHHHHDYHRFHQRAYFLALNRSRYQQLSSYEVISNRWYTFPLGFLPSVAYPVCAAGGLICFLSPNFDTGYTSLLVCNPVTRKWKELPAMLNYNRVPFLVSMVVDKEKLGYKVLVAGGVEDSTSHQHHRRSTEMYDSATGAWVECGMLPQGEEICRSIVEYRGYYVCLTRGPGSGLLAFNVESKEWVKMRTGKIPGFSKFRHLVECSGSILVIGKALRRYVLGLYIWCLDPGTLRWREVGRMPRAMCERFFTSPSECFYCTAHAHLIFFCRYYYNHALVYNTLDNTWHQVSGCPLLTHPLLLPFDPGLDPVD